MTDVPSIGLTGRIRLRLNGRLFPRLSIDVEERVRGAWPTHPGISQRGTYLAIPVKRPADGSDLRPIVTVWREADVHDALMIGGAPFVPEKEGERCGLDPRVCLF